MVMNYPQSGLLIPSGDTVPPISAGILSNHAGSVSYGSDFTYEDVTLYPIEVYMQGSGAVGGGSLGLVRGFVHSPSIDMRIYPRHILRSMGVISQAEFEALRIKDLSSFRVSSDGYRYAYGKLADGSCKVSQMFLTDNPEVW